jgi:hypothetical protein
MAKITVRGAHDEIEHVPARAAAKTVENFLLVIEIERGMPLTVKRAEAHVLPTAAAQARVAASDGDKVGSPLHFTCIERGSEYHGRLLSD